jgi:hypothetical protein
MIFFEKITDEEVEMTGMHNALSPTPRAHEWEMIEAFTLRLPEQRRAPGDCLIEPLVEVLLQFDMNDDLLCQISKAVEQSGEELRSCCQDERLDCVEVRVYASRNALRGGVKTWRYDVLKQMASSESDNLDGMQHPTCLVDVRVYPA